MMCSQEIFVIFRKDMTLWSYNIELPEITAWEHGVMTSFVLFLENTDLFYKFAVINPLLSLQQLFLVQMYH